MDRDRVDDASDPGWKALGRLLETASNDVHVFDATVGHGRQAVASLELPSGSLLAAVVGRTGGMMVDHAWLRLLGSGGDGLLTWNALDEPDLPERLVVAHDAVGGFFSVRRAGPSDETSVEYFAPDTLRWEHLGFDYGGFLAWALTGDVASFYAGLRWEGWEGECAALDPNSGCSIYPFLWSSEGGPISSRARRPVAMRELWSLHNYLAMQIASLPEGASVEFRVRD